MGSYRHKGSKDELKRFSERLREQRISTQKSQTRIAESAGLSVKTLNSYERGVHWPSLGAYSAICVALGLGKPPMMG
jgi:transcriptional regulator with XRE-family HTH domain